MNPVRKPYNVAVNSGSSVSSHQSKKGSSQTFRSRSTSTYDDGSTASNKTYQRSKTNKRGKEKTKLRVVESARDSKGRLLYRQVDKDGNKTKTRVTGAGKKAGY